MDHDDHDVFVACDVDGCPERLGPTPAIVALLVQRLRWQVDAVATITDRGVPVTVTRCPRHTAQVMDQEVARRLLGRDTEELVCPECGPGGHRWEWDRDAQQVRARCSVHGTWTPLPPPSTLTAPEPGPEPASTVRELASDLQDALGRGAEEYTLVRAAGRAAAAHGPGLPGLLPIAESLLSVLQSDRRRRTEVLAGRCRAALRALPAVTGRRAPLPAVPDLAPHGDGEAQSQPRLGPLIALEPIAVPAGFDEVLWYEAAGAGLAAAAVAAHHLGVHLHSAQVTATDAHGVRQELRVGPVEHEQVAVIVTAAALAHQRSLGDLGAGPNERGRADLLAGLNRIRWLGDDPELVDRARQRAHRIVDTHQDLIEKAAPFARYPPKPGRSPLTYLHVAALADPARPDPPVGAPVMRPDPDVEGRAGRDTVVVAVLPALTGPLAAVLEAVAAVVARHTDTLSLVDPHHVQWPLMWAFAPTGEEITAVIDDVHRWAQQHPEGVAATGRLVVHESDVKIAAHPDYAAPAQAAHSALRRIQLAHRREKRDRFDAGYLLDPAGVHGMVVARCHTPGLGDLLRRDLDVDRDGSGPELPVPLGAVAVIRQRCDGAGRITAWDTLAEYPLAPHAKGRP
ncbi:hypothetical protein MRI28_17105 [Nocardiopsis dassonvillei]|uniref:hypothetical protein n=1 Tax=Nocardiopsis dassonvillei TaxID=2014 RepID=UPI00200C5664|nr:hypothetical protein [Nocardiopsis dassonvillei]MCK9871334.1 hypothetical protein [Nocardiopsis dassonvillei]